LKLKSIPKKIFRSKSRDRLSFFRFTIKQLLIVSTDLEPTHIVGNPFKHSIRPGTTIIYSTNNFGSITQVYDYQNPDLQIGFQLNCNILTIKESLIVNAEIPHSEST
jgi:hypothetical protein